MIRWSHVVLASLGMTGLAVAQPYSSPPPSAPASPVRLGADLAVVLPTGDYADGITAAVGPFGRLEFGLSPQLAVTGRVGFLYHFFEEDPGFDVSIMMFPIYGGIRYNVMPSGGGLFLTGEAGLNIVRFSATVFGEEVSDSETNLSLNVGAGYQAGPVNFKGTLFFTADAGNGDADVEGDGTNLVGVMAAVGFDFTGM
jgi:Outer membrane protein beta-barrel domain